ncbi:hypothetical protein HW130_32320 [Streptomyces sp. PKU-EA00015]|uniref:hypothetical protein n=1 Tax=Streptomyces sp. PKU-EA00015 TaxID=2748326 RepID=UPI0015A33CF7|nr:hypothetical protein [Streptomyces sp. PKU-EA00015]NWF30878.1 hypothetical protein [Streptomyces sp. PKU-EA00015]
MLPPRESAEPASKPVPLVQAGPVPFGPVDDLVAVAAALNGPDDVVYIDRRACLA